MPAKENNAPDVADDRARAKNRRIGGTAAILMRLVSMTLRVRLIDHCGFLEKRPDHPLIHALWHNGIFSWPFIYRKFWGDRNGAALTSASKDGEIVAAAIEAFDIAAVRGSNSRRGAAALIELKKWIKTGHDIAITPDGPRGPMHYLQPGIIILAQKTAVPILPFRFVYHRAWKLKTWDRFQIPAPFSRVDVHLGPYAEIPKKMTESEFEIERQRVESILLEGVEPSKSAAEA